jgi:hypothetical protein
MPSEESKDEVRHADPFDRHLIGKLKVYENFNQKGDRFSDLGEYSWAINGLDTYTKHLPSGAVELAEA